MNSNVASFSTQRSGILAPICLGGLACGVLDISAALIRYRQVGVGPERLLQGIASGMLGPRAFDGGAATAFLGLCCHFFIAFAAASVFVLLSRRAAFLVEHPIISGAVYGWIVYFFMQLVVLPLSAIGRSPHSLSMTFIGLAIHTVCVGLPISLVASRFLLNP